MLLLHTVEAFVRMDLVESNGLSGFNLNLLLTDNAVNVDGPFLSPGAIFRDVFDN